MNIIELQDNLKDLPDRRLIQEMQTPTGNMPQFLVLSELTRRKRMRDDYNRQDAANMPTVAEEVMTAAGVPQGGITAIARNMAPNSSIAQNTSADMAVQREPTRAPQMMADGGILEMNEGGGLSGLLQGIFGFGRGDEDIGKPVQPYPENSPNPRDRSTWMRMYGETHNLDGSPKTMSPNISEINKPTDYKSPFVSDVSADVGDFTPTVPGAAQDPSTDLDIGNILAGSQKFGFDRIPNQDTTSGLPVAAPDFDATDEEDFLDAESERLDQLDVAAANMGDQPLPDVSQIDPETNLDISAALGIGSLGTNLADAMNNPIGDLPFLPPPTRDTREPSSPTDATIGSYGRTTVGQTKDEIERMNQMLDLEGIGPSTAGEIISSAITEEQNNRESSDSTLSGNNFSNDPTTGYSYPTDVLPLDPRMEGRQVAGRVIDALTEGEGGGLPEDIYGGFEDPEAIARRQESLRKPTGLPDELRYDDPDISEFLTPSLGQTTGTGLSLEGGVESLLPPSLTGSDTGDGLGDDGLGGDTGGGAGSTVGDSYSTLEGRIAKMLADREKSAESDKYLALAQAGLALMASDSPTLGGAIGEAGLVGISQMREARNQYDKDILGLLGTQADIDAARRDASLSERQFGLKERELKLLEAEAALPPGLSASERNAFLRESGDLFSELNSLNTIIESGIRQGEYGPETISEAEKNALIKERNALQSQYNKFIGLVNPNLANIQTAE